MKPNHESQVDGAEGFRAKFRPAGRQVLEEVGFHADLEAGDWQRADRKEQPNRTRTAMSWVCVMPIRSVGWIFQSTLMFIQFVSFLSTLGVELRLYLGT